MSSSVDLWYATRATGLAALVLLSATVVLGISTAGRATSGRWPGFARAELHKRVSAATVVLLAVHVLTSVLDTYVHIGWASIVLPFSSLYDRFWTGLGTVGADLMAAVLVSSALRRAIPARAWRGLHWLAYASWPVAVAHAVGMGTDLRLAAVDALVASCILAVLVAATSRLVGALRRRAARPTLAGPQLRRTYRGIPGQRAIRHEHLVRATGPTLPATAPTQGH
ncbi:MAG TPA: ferric reductase-like transmembrane domain-containing protein [Acidimicrobiales bacterium]|nr:ferric reductase-like transmembrane domain-containing protein [Acidimicrobiales bacterium]